MLPSWAVRQGDAIEVMRGMEPESVHCVVTSPPYWGLRNYGMDGAYGLEPTLDEYIANMVEVFREVRRVLRKDGSLWLNLGDGYAHGATKPHSVMRHGMEHGSSAWSLREQGTAPTLGNGLKPKDLIGLPWRVAFALQADGWWLRSDIVWHKPNPMPESVTDRPTRSHEYVFLLTKSARYFYDADAVREPAAIGTQRHREEPYTEYQAPGQAKNHMGKWRNQTSKEEQQAMGANKRDVWMIATQPYKGSHFATFPEALVEPCILAGTSVHGVPRASLDIQTIGWQPTCDHGLEPAPAVVLDPFCGSGTTGVVALRYGRSFAGIELNAEYVQLARRRIIDDAPLLNSPAERRLGLMP